MITTRARQSRTPALNWSADFRGGERQGTWRLLIQDVLDPDTGTLNAWALQITSGGVTTQYDAAGLPAALVDAGEITFTLNVPDAGVIEDVNVTLDVAHSYIGDLTITLTAPNDVPVVLHAQSGLDADSIQRTYDEESGITRETTSGPDGTFSFADVPADVYSLYCNADLYMSGFDAAIVEEGGTSEIFFNLHYTGCVPISNAFEILGATRGTVPVTGGVQVAISVTGIPEDKLPQVTIGGE
ncbi:MAG: proprotein convertase P-domain-containing protein, partial [Candidatus Hydrogenedentes bacterium]|nr:proprotein convertase P-domain-containing protein [Candidatus Hydrogenedentota bacterium]